MPTKYKLPNYTVYVDANVAYSRKPSEPISAKLLKFVDQARAQTPTDVRIPEVVIEELAYQQFVLAQAAAENLKKNVKTLSDVCGSQELAVPDADSLKSGAKQVISKLLQTARLSRLPTPTAKIDWDSVIDDSCWRRSPFEKPKSEDDLAEKGFRDKIILEAIKFDAATVQDGVIAFVSGDNRLREAFKNQAKAKCPIEVYARFDEFLGDLELLAKTQSRKFTDDVLGKVASVFFDPNNPNCVVLSQGVLQKLVADHSEELSHPSLFNWGAPKYPGTLPSFSTATQPLAGASTPYANWFEEFNQWTPVTPVKAFASPPIFQPGSGDGRYHWISTITLVRLLRRITPHSGRAYSLPEERIRTKDVDVAWSCEINPDTAEFSNASVDEYIPTTRESFIEADWRSRSAYEFPLFPEIGGTAAS